MTNPSRWAKDHDLRFEVHPILTMRAGILHHEGHQVEITCRAPDLDPGCPRCAAAYARVREIALAALPDADLVPLCRLPPFEPVTRFRAGTGPPTPEIELDIEVAAEEGEKRETACLRRIEDHLRSMGVRHD